MYWNKNCHWSICDKERNLLWYIGQNCTTVAHFSQLLALRNHMSWKAQRLVKEHFRIPSVRRGKRTTTAIIKSKFLPVELFECRRVRNANKRWLIFFFCRLSTSISLHIYDLSEKKTLQTWKRIGIKKYVEKSALIYLSFSPHSTQIKCYVKMAKWLGMQ